MEELKQFFENINKTRKNFAPANKGSDFEQIIRGDLKKFGFTEMVHHQKNSSQIVKYISNYEEIDEKIAKKKWFDVKNAFKEKKSLEIIANPFKKIKRFFIFQPNGSQDFPDFLLILDNSIIPLEIKFSKNRTKRNDLNSFKPMWNSNIPKQNAIYIYGVANEDTTYFLGSDILEIDTRNALIDFFEKIDKGEKKSIEDLKKLKNDFGIYPYIRKAYEHKASKSTYLDVNGNKKVQSYFSDERIKREKNVIDFVEQLK